MDHKLVFPESVDASGVKAGDLFIIWLLTAPEGIRFGQWVVNEFLEQGKTWPELYDVTCPIKASRLIDEQLDLQREA